MRKRTWRPADARLRWILAPFAVLFGAMGWSMLVQGCPSRVGDGAEAQRTTAARDAELFRPVDGEAASPRRASSEALLREALAGVVDAPESDLGSRMQVRELRRPRPPRGATARFDFDGGRRGWITALPSEQLLTSPAFANGKVYLGGGFASHQFYAFDAYEGDLEWSLAAPDGGPTAAIIVDDRVIFNTESCTLFVADADTGELKWKRWLGDPLMSQPVAAGDLVMSAYPANGAHRFAAFRLDDGTPVWDVPIPADVIQAPQAQGESVFFATMDGTAHRLRVRDGHVQWKRDVGASSALWVDGDDVLLSRRVDGRGEVTEQPIVLAARDGSVVSRGDTVPAPYLGGTSRDRQMMHGQSGAWGRVPHGQHLGLTNVAAGWAFQGSSPAVADGRAYFAVGPDIRARDMRTGEEVWRRSYGQAQGAQAISPPAVVGSQLVFGTVDGHLYAADIDTGMTTWAYDVGEPIVFQPIVAQGWVYVATARGSVIGLEMGDAAFDGWHMWGGNAQHAGLVETAGSVDPALLASLERPGQGTLRVAAFETPAEETAIDAVPAPPAAAAAVQDEEADEPVHPDLPLVSTRVEARISGMVARVTVTQRFDNPHDRPIEALYLFPLPAEAAVDDMEMHVGDRVIRGRIQRRAQARRTYEEARESGRRAALLEQQRPNLFAQRVANVQPREHVDVRIQYVQMLPFDDGQYEMVFPMVAPPRYDPADPSAVLGAENEVRQAEDVQLSVALDAGMPLEAVASPTHRVHIERAGETAASVRLDAAGERPNRDFVLRYAVGGEVPRATVLAHREDGDGPGHFSLLVQPPAEPPGETIAPRDLTFVVDTSSSMRGRPMEHAQAVMRAVLEGVREGDTFNVLSFSDQVEHLSATPLGGTPANLRRAVEFVDAMRATGSTEMVPAIRRALAGPGTGDRLPIVVLLTDGYIGNEADVLRAIAEDLGDARVYAVGVGSSVNRFLLERAAEIGRGRTVVATLSEPPADAAARFAALVDRPVFTDVEIDWGGLAVEDVYPRRLPDLFAGKPLVVHGRYTQGGSARVKVRGTLGGRRYERIVEVELPRASADRTHAAHGTLWARAAVKDRMNRLFLRDDPALIEEVTELGLAHRMVTQWTSFVAVDETPAAPAPEDAEAEVASRATVSPARALPGDPEIRIPAPADARAVTVILPFGETLSAVWEPSLGLWAARFLIPADAAEGAHPIEILVTLANGSQDRHTIWYTVDASAPLVQAEIVGEPRPGAEVIIRATQVVTESDLAQAGHSPTATLSPQRVQLLSDARRVEARTPAGDVIDLELAGPGIWEGRWRIPSEARGSVALELFVVDLAANVRTQTLEVELAEVGR